MTNQRNGKGAKTVLTEDGPDPYRSAARPRRQRRFTGFDDKIVAMYARGMTVREIQGFLQEQYGTGVST